VTRSELHIRNAARHFVAERSAPGKALCVNRREPHEAARRENAIVRTILIALWKIFSDLDLSEAKKRKFKSVHDCFTRERKDGARPVDMNEGLLVSPFATRSSAPAAPCATECCSRRRASPIR
jgi:hypothetical protein